MKINFLYQPIYYFLLLIVFGVTSCKDAEYEVVVDVLEFEIKHSPDLIDRKPEAYILLDTDSGYINNNDRSHIYNEYKVDFVAEGKTVQLKAKGDSIDDEYVFSVDMYDADFSLFGDDDDYIDGITMHIKKNTGILSETITVDSRELYMVFTYTIKLRENK